MRRMVMLGLLVGSNAYADHTTLHFIAAGSVAATDNVFGTSTGTESDMFFQIRPGVLLSHDGPRLIQVYTAEAEILEYVSHSEDPSVTYRAAWKGDFLVSPLVDVVGSAAFSTGTLNALTARGTPDQPVVNIVPAGNSLVTQVDAAQVLTKQLDKAYRFRQGLAGHYAGSQDSQSDATTSSFDGDLTFGIDRTSEKDNFALLLDLDYVRLRRFVPDAVPPPNPPVPTGSRQDQQLNPRIALTWRHDYNRYWSSSATAGVTTLNPFGTDPFNPTDHHRPAGAYAVGAAQVSYSEIWGHATLLAARTVSPDLLLAETTQTTSVTASLSLPLPFLDDHRRLAPKLVAAASAGILQSEVIPTEVIAGALGQGTFDAYHADVGILYSPVPSQSYGLRYEYVRQTGDAQAIMLLPSYSRSTIFFTFTFRYPERLAVDLKDLHDPTQSNRADRTDVVPMTDSEAPKEDDAGPNGVTGAKPVDD